MTQEQKTILIKTLKSGFAVFGDFFLLFEIEADAEYPNYITVDELKRYKEINRRLFADQFHMKLKLSAIYKREILLAILSNDVFRIDRLYSDFLRMVALLRSDISDFEMDWYGSLVLNKLPVCQQKK